MGKDTIVIGIDLGTTYSCVACWMNSSDRPEVLENFQGSRTTPSIVAFTDTEVLVGEPAKNQSVTNPKNTVYDSKRLIGKKIDGENKEETEEINNNIKLWPFEVRASSKNKNIPVFVVDFKGKKQEFRPEEISAFILAEMRSIAEKKIGKKIKHAVVTVPAYFNDSQRQGTKDAAKIAGLNVLRMINEPTAAALAYGLKKLNRNMTILVYDLGGGTLDVSLLELNEGIFEVKATNGNNYLGGQDFENEILAMCVEQFKKDTGLDITSNPRALKRLKLECQKAKHFLSSSINATISVSDLAGGNDFSWKLNRAKFERANKKRFDDALLPVRDVLKEAKLTKEDIDEVILIGGSTRIPKVQQMLQEEFDGKKLCTEVNPDEAVAVGAAIQGAILAPFQRDVKEVKDHSTGKVWSRTQEEEDEEEEYKKKGKKLIKQDSNEDKNSNNNNNNNSNNNSNKNNNDNDTIGGAILENNDNDLDTKEKSNEKSEKVQKEKKLKGEKKELDEVEEKEDKNVSNFGKLSKITLIDVTPLSLGIAVGKEDKMSKIIPKNTPIPVKKTRVYTTLFDNQTMVKIPVYQGEGEFVKQNHHLGEFMLKNIPLAKKGVPRFDTTFEIDANGILQVTAQLKGSDEIYKITISKALNMNQEEVNESAKKTQGLLKEKAILEEISRQQQQLCDQCNTLLDSVSDSKFQTTAGEIADWCDSKEHPTQKELDEKIKELKDAYKKATNKELKLSFEGPSFDDVDDDLLN